MNESTQPLTLVCRHFATECNDAEIAKLKKRESSCALQNIYIEAREYEVEKSAVLMPTCIGKTAAMHR